MKAKIVQRVREPSTWAGLAIIFQAVAPIFPAWGGVLMGLSALLGAVAVKIPEGAGNAAPTSGPLASVVGEHDAGQ